MIKEKIEPIFIRFLFNFIIATVFIILSCKTEKSNDTMSEEFLPITSGNTWTFVNENGSDTLQIELGNAIPKGFEGVGTVYPFREDSAFCIFEEVIYLVHKNNKGEWKRNRELIHKPLYSGQYWTYNLGNEYWSTRVWNADLNHSGRGGNFPHCRFLHTIQQMRTSIIIIEEIYAPNIGLVLKRIDNDNDGNWDQIWHLITWEIKK